MPHEIVDETRGPGVPLTGGNLYEIWQSLGKPDRRTPTLDEVLQEIRLLRERDVPPERAELPPFPHNEKVVLEPPLDGGGLRQMTYPDGQVITGYSADDVLKLREAYLEERVDL
jgi:hypothetical protein